MIGHDKKKLRNFLRSELKLLGEEERLSKESLVVNNLVKLISQLNLKREVIIGGFAPLKDEVNWTTFLSFKNVVTAFPAVKETHQKNFSMAFYLCEFESLVESLDFGVPILGPPIIDANEVVPDILFIPGLGFSTNGKRIGRGKGYYDRYLKNYTGHRVGICFSEQVVSAIPTDDYDQNIHILVTDKDIHHCHQNEGDE